MFTRLGCDGTASALRVEFYPYRACSDDPASRRSCLRALFRLLQRAPRAVLEGAARYCWARYRRKLRQSLPSYLEYARSNDAQRMNRMRRGGSPAATNPRGNTSIWTDFSTSSMGNTCGQLQRPAHWLEHAKLAPAIRVYDPAKSNLLNAAWTARRSGLRRGYVLFHEMLHVKAPTRRSGLQHGFAFPRISRRREAASSILPVRVPSWTRWPNEERELCHYRAELNCNQVIFGTCPHAI